MDADFRDSTLGLVHAQKPWGSLSHTQILVPISLDIDVFCRVVDNFGDIGVCWRLARQLGTLAGAGRVRLWVDNLHAFGRIQPGIAPLADRQVLGGVEIVRWTDPAPDLAPLDIVIEAFACDPPPGFIRRMGKGRHVWINLEYLSAESWIESCHARPSMQPNGMIKSFFFPGFTAASGGLPREDGLLDQRDRWRSDPSRRWRLLRDIGLPAPRIADLRAGGFQAFLFCYPQAPVQSLLDALACLGRPGVVIVPDGVAPDLPEPPPGPVHVHRMPFVDQDGFDRLLWSSDLNLVRGEDSLVRATWAGKPLIWHIYPQAGQTHMTKLEAWLAESGYPGQADAANRAWNTGNAEVFRNNLPDLLRQPAWAAWCGACEQRARFLTARPPLARALLDYCAKQWQTG